MRRLISPLKPMGSILTADWWPVVGKTALAAYQAIGAASQAAAKINLENPGTYDAVAVDTEASWSALRGFIFSGVGGYDTGISGADIKTTIVRVANLDRSSTIAIFRVIDPVDSTGRNGITMISTDTFFEHGSFASVADTATSGVYAVSAQNGYKDGSDVCDIPTAPDIEAINMYFGMSNRSGFEYYLNGDILAIAFYSDELTPTEIAALTTRMDAL